MKKKKYISTIIILILLVFVFAILAFLVKRNDDKNNIDALQKISSDNQISSQIFISSENESADEKQPVSSEIEKEKAKPITILGAGDNLIHTGIYLQASRRANGNGYSFDYAYEDVAEYVGSADISCLNQETPLTDFFEPSSYPMFNCPTKMGLQMIDIGFDVINQANNHALDKGENGVKYTIEFWDSVKDKAKMIGMYKNKQDEENVCIIDKDGTKISFVSYTQHTNGLSLPKSSEFVVSNENNIIERIKKAKSLSDIVVVNAHWGEEYTFTPNDKQKSMANEMVMAGADIIFGHHPHVLQPIEYIEKPDGKKAVVIYSLGNFISAQDKAKSMLGGLATVTVSKEDGVTSCDFMPIITHFGSGYSNIKEYMFSNYTLELANSHGVKAFDNKFSYEYIQNIINDVIAEDFLHKYNALKNNN